MDETRTVTTHTVTTRAATLTYDVHGPLPPTDSRRPLLMVGAPMGAEGFGSLAARFADRTVVTYDPRGLGRSVRHDGSTAHTPEQNADDQHAVIADLAAGPVDMFASSGGAVSALALVAAHPEDVATLVAHEPPLLGLLPDADRAFAAERAVHDVYHERGWGHGMAAFIGFTAWTGPLTDTYAAQPVPDPAMFGIPGDDDGSRTDPLLSGVSNAITAYLPDAEAVTSAPTRIVVGMGADSEGLLTGRTSEATAAALGLSAVVFPGGHGGFLGGEHGQQGDPDGFATTLRAVLGAD